MGDGAGAPKYDGRRGTEVKARGARLRHASCARKTSLHVFAFGTSLILESF